MLRLFTLFLVYLIICIFASKKQNYMNNKEPGYVYILTNPSFCED